MEKYLYKRFSNETNRALDWFGSVRVWPNQTWVGVDWFGYLGFWVGVVNGRGAAGGNFKMCLVFLFIFWLMF